MCVHTHTHTHTHTPGGASTTGATMAATSSRDTPAIQKMRRWNTGKLLTHNKTIRQKRGKKKAVGILGTQKGEKKSRWNTGKLLTHNTTIRVVVVVVVVEVVVVVVIAK